MKFNKNKELALAKLIVTGIFILGTVVACVSVHPIVGLIIWAFFDMLVVAGVVHDYVNDPANFPPEDKDFDEYSQDATVPDEAWGCSSRLCDTKH